uniref:Replication-associated protein ORF2/G2P domain-containing protein n=1 Tax=uncultured prokaryote TaxID=198431 RepID=A0A0H5Q458_9ZZZZ|nr:hypothetical protein [uncultured prokaryote]
MSNMTGSVGGGIRGQVGGWSMKATRRNTDFLRSIDERKLSGAGVALTLTLKTCPETADDWHRLRKNWQDRMRRAGMVRIHWVTEWQRRGVPHLHVALWWPDKYRISDPVEAWLALAAPYGAGAKGQHGKPIDGPVGWFQYLSKHAARGVKHYQRSGDNMPPGWKEKTGRVWGYGGDWPLQDPVNVQLDDDGFYAFRRLVRSWRIGNARASGDKAREIHAKRMLHYPGNPKISALRPVSEWCNQAQALMFLGNLASRGYGFDLLPSEPKAVTVAEVRGTPSS